MFKRIVGIAVAMGAMLAAAGVPAASPQTQSFTVNLTITADCVVGAGSDINFGAAGYLTANIDAAGSFLVGCTPGTVPDISLNDGLHNGACAASARCMLSATTGEYVDYELYTDAGRTTLWTSALVVNPVTGTGAVAAGVPVADQTVDVFGRVPPQTTPTPAADYTDTVTATVTF